MTANDNPNPRSLAEVTRVEISNLAQLANPHISLSQQAVPATADQPLWVAIRDRTRAIGFDRYSAFISKILCEGDFSGPTKGVLPACGDATNPGDIGSPSLKAQRDALAGRPAIFGVDAYNVLRLATEVFLLMETGVVRKDASGQRTSLDPTLFDATDEGKRLGTTVTIADVQAKLQQYLGASGTLPYLQRIVQALVGTDTPDESRLPYCDDVLSSRFHCPSMIELIWSYWHEAGMMVQSINAVALRFQNRRAPNGRDVLGHLEIDPLRGLNNLLWGYVQNDYRRLSLARRVYEYDHHYGLTLTGRAVPKLRSADSRSRFIEAFHHVLHRAAMFYLEDADTTVRADAFPLLNAIRELHLVLAEGAHNQFGDLPWTARVEMLTEQWLLSRPEMRVFLQGRAMVPYQEPWMNAVDTMKSLQGWSTASVSHFHELAQFGEQLLLSVRYGDWVAANDQDQARNWARYWQPEVQRYIHSYQSVTGVDLSAASVTDGNRDALRYAQPSALIQARAPERLPRTAPGTRVPAGRFSAAARVMAYDDRRLLDSGE